MLSAATMSDLSYIYGPKGRTFDKEALTAKLHELIVTVQFSEILRATIVNLCEIDPAARVTSKELAEWVAVYQAKIRTRRNFVIESAPHKLHNQVQCLRKVMPLIV